MSIDIITGEKIQMLCDYYIGTDYDFKYNPLIYIHHNKHIYINNYDINYIKKLM